ncbi:MAG: Na+/H+ antiporter NhaC family protein [Eubacteriales bacterium]|nr:Na+/H+ antiporter NhaC family protein [Eubacteriales bacterium]NLF46999.1 TRAP transporter large permease subunit [Clostridiales bacterium]
MELGFLTIVPLILMVVSVIVTKRVFESMIIPIILVFVLKDGTGFIGGFVDSFYEVMAEGTFPWILMMLTLFGALIQLLLESGGIDGFRRLALRYIKAERSSLVFTWILGLILCIDDYINDLAIGPSVRSITDRYKVPREAVGTVVISMGVPICSLLPVTAMAVFVFGIMKDSGISGENAGMLTEYMKVVPFLVYPMLIVLVAFLLAVGILPKIGPLRKLSKQMQEETEIAEEHQQFDEKGQLLDFIIPVLVLVGVMLYTNDLVVAVLIAIAVCFALYIPRKKMKFDDFFKNFFEGVHSMIDILVILLMVFIFVNGLTGIGLSEYVIETTTPFLAGGAIPVLTFIVVALLAFGGVDYWAVILLMAPITIPLAVNFDVNVYLTMAAAVSGAVCGGTSCFFGEQMLMCSQAVEKKPTELAVANLPYSIIAFVGTAVIYAILGFVL